MVLGLVGLVLVVLVAGAVVYGIWTAWRLLQPGSGRALPARDRAWLAESIAHACWAPAHDEVDGSTRVLLRRSCTGLDGRPEVLEERVFAAFPADDPAWEARFTEAMSSARFRCSYLNAEDAPG